ncbi:MAG: hypothetical protein J4F41_09405 [Alphaproteobacteria bacterium]|nr:hypothetical protein [Alphaproteobacteria bacterium]
MFDKEISIDQLASGKPLVLSLTADRASCEELAERFDWIEVCSLTAEIKLKAIANGAYHASGQVDAAIIQRCRLTENPVPESLIVKVNERFATIDDEDEEAEIDPMAVSVEGLKGDKIPVGEMIAQLVGIEATPWPRDPSAESRVLSPENDPTNPFASLAELKKKL